jgi:hypothetical protein
MEINLGLMIGQYSTPANVPMKRSLRTSTNVGLGFENGDGHTKIITSKEEKKRGQEDSQPTQPLPETISQLGPQKSSSKPPSNNQKYAVRFDYKADRCKDFTDTGYCGFGDSCVFLHDRSEYKTSWELDAEFEAQQASKPEATKESVDYDKICLICKKDEMIQPKMLPECRHQFCAECISNRLRLKLKCPNCKKSVIGTLKTPISPFIKQ